MAQGWWGERDSDGWRIPRHGTKSAVIYKHLKNGLGPLEISEKIGDNRNNVAVLAWRIKNPTRANEIALNTYHACK